MTATISGSAVSTLVALTTTGNTILGDASTDTLNVGNGGLVKDASGNVGIGTASPTAQLNLNAATDTTAYNGAATDGQLTAGATQLIRAAAGANTNVAQLVFQTRAAQPFNRIVSSGGTAPFMAFVTNNAEQMRIDSSGNLLVGTTSFPASSAKQALGFDGAAGNGFGIYDTRTSAGSDQTVIFYRGTTVVGQINTTLTATSYVTSSDYRLKENVAVMVGALDKVAQLKPVTYKWKADGSDSQGFIAHELQAIVPECVVGEKDAVDAEGNPQYQGIDTSFLVATLTAAIQEQQALITSLTTRLTALENK